MTVVRHASPFDIPAIIDMLRDYRDQSTLPFLAAANDAEYIKLLLTQIISGNGIALIAETDKPAGMLIATIQPSIWSPKSLLLTELAYWVQPAFRGTSAAYRLLIKYVAEGKKLKESGRVSNCLISKMVTSPNLSYDKLGFEKLEEFWVL